MQLKYAFLSARTHLPRPRRWCASKSCAAGLLCCVLWHASSAIAHADREHTVGKGQTLSRIAAQYGVSAAALAAANGLERSGAIRPGQVLVVPPRGVVYASPGDSLASIAHRHEVSADDLAHANHLIPGTPLRLGQRLLLPGEESANEQRAAEQRWGGPRHPGLVSLYRVWSEESQRVRLLDERGRVRRTALTELTHLLRPRSANKKDKSAGKEPHPRLLRLLAQVSDHFGGRPIHIISGYRQPGGYTKTTSRHVAAQAIDFRIPGVPLEALRDYCAKLDHVGVGFYPRTQFVHLDVRRDSARWTDYSGAGEAPLREPKAASEQRNPDSSASDEPDAADDGQPPIDEQPDALSDQ
jgi:uncharacterized protein YcbK (DUF882 family)